MHTLETVSEGSWGRPRRLYPESVITNYQEKALRRSLSLLLLAGANALHASRHYLHLHQSSAVAYQLSYSHSLCHLLSLPFLSLSLSLSLFASSQHTSLSCTAVPSPCLLQFHFLVAKKERMDLWEIFFLRKLPKQQPALKATIDFFFFFNITIFLLFKFFFSNGKTCSLWSNWDVMLQDLSASVLFPPCLQHRSFG